jgi:methionyl-tRNA synthetase
VKSGNEFVQSSQPWALAKDPAKRKELDDVLGALARHLARHAVCLFAFMPAKAAALWTQLGASGALEDQRFATLSTLDPTGWRVSKGDSLFPRPTTSPA